MDVVRHCEEGIGSLTVVTVYIYSAPCSSISPRKCDAGMGSCEGWRVEAVQPGQSLYSPKRRRTRLSTLSFSGSYGWSLEGISSRAGNAAV